MVMGDVGMSTPVTMDATWAAWQKKHRDCVPWTVTAWKGHQNTALLPWWDGLPDPSVCECQCVAPCWQCVVRRSDPSAT